MGLWACIVRTQVGIREQPLCATYCVVVTDVVKSFEETLIEDFLLLLFMALSEVIMATSQEYKTFLATTVKAKLVTALPSISEVLGKRLTEKGSVKASRVLAKFFDLDKDEEQFKAWLGSTCCANPKQQSDCYNCLVDWSEEPKLETCSQIL